MLVGNRMLAAAAVFTITGAGATRADPRHITIEAHDYAYVVPETALPGPIGNVPDSVADTNGGVLCSVSAACSTRVRYRSKRSTPARAAHATTP